MAKFFIKKAIHKKGSLRAYVHREYGSKGFDSKGRIKESTLRDIEKHGSLKEKRRANLAMTLRKF